MMAGLTVRGEPIIGTEIVDDPCALWASLRKEAP
jgi:hypothetical protein